MYERYFYFWRSLILLSLLVIVAALVGAGPADAGEAKRGKNSLCPAVRKVAELNIPAVVHVEAIMREEAMTQGDSVANGSFIKQFFNLPNMSVKLPRELKKFGTGIIMDTRGYVLTNQHVVAGATEIHVLLVSAKRYPAMLVGTDYQMDMAVIRVLTQDALPHVTFGNSNRVEAGEPVLAVAHPRARQPSVVQGTLLGKHGGGVQTAMKNCDYLKTQAVMNVGNFGGPLLNLRGEVIGVNTATLSPSGGLNGITFSIPSNMALQIARQLIARRAGSHKSSGTPIVCLSSSLTECVDVHNLRCLFRPQVGHRSQSNKTPGMQGVTIATHASTAATASSMAGEPGMVGGDLQRGRAELVNGGELEMGWDAQSLPIRRRLGVVPRPATPKEASKYDLHPRQSVVIRWLDPTGALARTGVEVDDMMLGINGKPINGLEHLLNLASTLRPKQRVVIRILDHRTGRRGYVQVRTY